MAKAPWFPFYPADWVTDGKVKALSLELQGAYVRLLCYQWMEGILPVESHCIATQCDLNRRLMGRLWRDLEQFFPVLSDGSGRANPRLDEHRKAWEAKHLEKSEAGKRGASARWHPHDSAIGDAIQSEMPVPLRPHRHVEPESESEEVPAVPDSEYVQDSEPPADEGEMSEDERQRRIRGEPMPGPVPPIAQGYRKPPNVTGHRS